MGRFVAAVLATALFGPYAAIGPAVAQEPDPKLRLKYCEQQRNQAMDNVTIVSAYAEDLQRQLAEAKKQIEELKKAKDEPPK